MNRTVIFLITSMLLFTACQNQPKVKTQPLKPNILFILADDLGYHDLSVMGSNYCETPNIDRIADEGMIFTDGYATCQVCSPSRASIMSGKFTARHGITDWIGAKTGSVLITKLLKCYDGKIIDPFLSLLIKNIFK
jgi:hypothetical protein